MSALAAVEVVALHNAREALALARTYHINNVACIEHGHVHTVADFVLSVFGGYLVQALYQWKLLLAQMPTFGLSKLLILGLAEAKLYSVIAIAGGGLHLSDHARSRLYNSHACGDATF